MEYFSKCRSFLTQSGAKAMQNKTKQNKQTDPWQAVGHVLILRVEYLVLGVEDPEHS